MATPSQLDTPLIGLEEQPSAPLSALAGAQHLLASLAGIIAPTLIITSALSLGAYTASLLSMALVMSGIATWIQSQRVGPFGSGLLSIQGTSFSFVAALITAGLIARAQGATDEQVLAILFGTCLAGSLIEMVLGTILPWLKRVITPVVTGVVVMLIGLSLIEVGMTDIGGGFGAEDFGAPVNLALAGCVLITVLSCQVSRYPWLRIASIFLGMAVGCTIAAIAGLYDAPQLADAALIALPMPATLSSGFDFSLPAFLPVAFIFMITAIETVGDLTGSARASGLPVNDDVHQKRLRGGVLADGLNSALAALAGTFPNTTFSQNTGVIQLTGIASRHVGRYVAGFLLLLGLSPFIATLLTQMPRPVLGATTTLMFALIAVSGIRILMAQTIGRREMMIIALSLGLGLGVGMVPEVLSALPHAYSDALRSPITMGGLTAIIAELLLPQIDDSETLPATSYSGEVPDTIKADQEHA
ncbi:MULTISPECIES: uracil-xanthine permease family protein [Cobetia]|uniref:Xanthine permease XanP n=1 Tax=Cobetia crustatorum TaxID=553385 RepID=A0A558HLJ3_9GAMM|nr:MULTISPECIES: solute carrier family 23 protein [Cobetia]TVU70014.1 xanthine permease XanP [Cobetia crustatorum]